MSDGQLLTRRRVVAGATAGSACAVAFASPTIRGKIADLAEGFQNAFSSQYASLEHGDHNLWAEQKGATFTTPQGHQLQVLDIKQFTPFGRRIEGVTRTRAFAVDFQLVAGGGLAVETLRTVSAPEGETMDLFLSAVGDTPGRVRAMFN